MALNKRICITRPGHGPREKFPCPAIAAWPSPGLVLRIFLLAALVCAGGCAYTPPVYQQEPPGKSTGLKALDAHAWDCYELGLEYMDQSRYELARQQFAFAASSAVSKTLYEDALEGMNRAEQIIRQQR
jgi:hypothetical protein